MRVHQNGAARPPRLPLLAPRFQPDALQTFKTPYLRRRHLHRVEHSGLPRPARRVHDGIQAHDAPAVCGQPAGAAARKNKISALRRHLCGRREDFRPPSLTKPPPPHLPKPQARARYWARSFAGWYEFSSVKPNPAHEGAAPLPKRLRLPPPRPQHAPPVRRLTANPSRRPNKTPPAASSLSLPQAWRGCRRAAGWAPSSRRTWTACTSARGPATCWSCTARRTA